MLKVLGASWFQLTSRAIFIDLGGVEMSLEVLLIRAHFVKSPFMFTGAAFSDFSEAASLAGEEASEERTIGAGALVTLPFPEIDEISSSVGS